MTFRHTTATRVRLHKRGVRQLRNLNEGPSSTGVAGEAYFVRRITWNQLRWGIGPRVFERQGARAYQDPPTSPKTLP